MNILVYLEIQGNKTKKASLEALSEAKRLAASSGGTVIAVTAGSSVAETVQKAAAHGAEKVYALENGDLEHYVPEAHVAAVVEAAGQAGAQVVMIAATTRGRDLGPRVAAKMNVMLMPDVTAVTAEGDNPEATRPVYAGKVYMKLKANELPVVITTRPNTFDLAEQSGAGERVDITPAYEAKAKVTAFDAAEAGKLDVTEADRVVSGGRGMKEPENFKLIEELADTLGAAVGATRAVVDAGWRPHSEQVGQTGKTVAPTLYFAIGISGAVQHLVGMRTSKTIVAINKDPDAPIFKVADYGVVGDAAQLVPALIEELKK
jgi:electron transfer flavoprotein alpha subunit